MRTIFLIFVLCFSCLCLFAQQNAPQVATTGKQNMQPPAKLVINNNPVTNSTTPPSLQRQKFVAAPQDATVKTGNAEANTTATPASAKRQKFVVQPSK